MICMARLMPVLRCRQFFLCVSVSGRVQAEVKCEWVFVIRATWGRLENLECVFCVTWRHIFCLFAYIMPANHAESRWSSYITFVLTAATMVTEAETSALTDFI